MTSTETIAAVLAAHDSITYLLDVHGWRCQCGYEKSRSPHSAHRAHVAAAIAEALGSNDDGLRERVEALAEEWERSNFATIWRGAAQLRAALNGATS